LFGYSRNLSQDSFFSYILSKLLHVLLKSKNDYFLSKIDLFIDYALRIMQESSDEKTLDYIMAYIHNYVKHYCSGENLVKIPNYVSNLMKINHNLIITVNYNLLCRITII
jgi:hypothetical protein